MKLVVAEKNIAAQKIAQLLADAGAPKNDKVYNTQVYRFKVGGEDWVSMGLAGHILAPDFPDEILFDKKMGWYSLTEDGEVLPAGVPDGLARPPYDTKRKPFLANGINIKGWKVESLPYLTWSPIIKNPAEKEIIRVLKNLAKKADEVIIATDFDREGELIGSDALNMIREVAPELPARRARYSALIKGEVTEAFANLVELDQDLADAGESRQYIDLIWGAVLTRYLTLAKFGGFGNVRSAGRVQTPTLALVVERERERMAFVPEDYWQIRGLGEASDQEFKVAHTTARFTDKAAAEAAFSHVEGETTGTVTAVAKRSRKQQPPVPFNTTALQAAAAAEGISPARTMRIAESLYMSGFISYPRVDNTVYPKTLDIEGIVRGLASGTPALAPVCKKILAGPLTPTRGKVETTDHPPIHPTGQGDPTTLDGGQLKLYNLIARRFLATLMGPPPSRTPSCPSMSAASRLPPAVMCWWRPASARLTRMASSATSSCPRWPRATSSTCATSSSRPSRPSRPRATAKASSSRRWKSAAWVPSRRARASSSACTRCAISRTTPSSPASSASPLSMRSRSSRLASPRPT